MSLRQRLLLAVFAALFASLAIGTWVTSLQAAHLVRTELAAALSTGVGSVAATLQDINGPPAPQALVRLVAGFDGSRHVLAELMAGGAVIARSHPAAPGVAVPGWFAALATPGFAPIVMPVPGGVLRLVPLPASEIGERWREARRLIELLAFSSCLAASFCFVTAAWSLRRLGPLAEAFARLEQGRQGGTVREQGPPEIVHLAASFNRMQAALSQAERENQRLSAQLDRIAEEERADLARDLHDEVGPLLFALTAWAAAARLQQQAGDTTATSASLQSLEDGAAALQRSVRDLLARLRDSAPTSTDLPQALAELLAFWREVRPGTVFTVSLSEGIDALAEPVRAALFRVAQEGVSNAIRHGNPTEVRIAVQIGPTRAALCVTDNGAAGEASGRGLGLVGLEERLQALGGALEIKRGQGWQITGWAPVP